MKKINIAVAIIGIFVLLITMTFLVMNKKEKVYILNANSSDDLSQLINRIEKDNIKNIEELSIVLESEDEKINNLLIKRLALVNGIKINKLNVGLIGKGGTFNGLDSIPFLNVDELNLVLNLPNTAIRGGVFCDVFKMDDVKKLSVAVNKVSNLEIDVISRCLGFIKNKEEVNLENVLRSEVPNSLELDYCKEDFIKNNNIKKLIGPKCADVDVDEFYDRHGFY